ncbi:hypothetical protein ACFVP3_11620 [Streptomyces sp. NPDC057806]|uniref:hypothetical protein n=1 Tax=unclassified Streptomyces TaxID=2593676 RepID=UPI00369C59E4
MELPLVVVAGGRSGAPGPWPGLTYPGTSALLPRRAGPALPHRAARPVAVVPQPE